MEQSQLRPPKTALSADWIKATTPLSGTAADHDPILQAARDARFVLLGESTHGTHEFYRERGRLSERLARELGFGAVAIEGDWSNTFRVNRYVRGLGSDKTADQALSGYQKFPRWMWRNAEFRDFIERLRAWNMEQPVERRVGVYGMDVYDIFDAADAVVAYLRRVNPAAANRARGHYRCFNGYQGKNELYGEATRNASRSCARAAAAVEVEVRRMPRPADPLEAEEHFAAVRSAASVVGGEEYFRATYAGSMSWNLRDQRMAQNVDAIAEHVGAVSGRPGKVVVWAHNSHVGDARATGMKNRGELNLGQLMRQRHGASAFLLGFLTYTGRVIAATEWDAPGRTFDVRPALEGSYADVFHSAGVPAFSLLLRGRQEIGRLIGEPRLERAIGVVYVPQSERASHYFEAILSDQFDAILFYDRTNPVTPLR